MSGTEPALIGAAAGLITAAIGFAVFWLTLGGRIGKLEASVGVAQSSAKEAKESVTLLQAGVQMFRETTIRDFVSHDHLNALERRLVTAQTQSETRVTEAIRGMSERLDRLIERISGEV